MDSSRIRSLATGVRGELRAEAAARLAAVLAEGSRERLEQPGRVRALEADVAAHGEAEVAERAAYTWFNRLCALRFMDARGYTPTPAVTPRDGQTQPAVLADAAAGVFDPEYEVGPETRSRVVALLSGAVPSANAAEEAYALLLSAVCARYAGPMGYLFAEDVASTLLMPSGLLSQGSVLARIVSEMDAGACESVEVLGWLYQFYVAERKDEYFRSKRKATAADIAPATQLFTPEWIVRYLAENSLGRLWVLNNPGSELEASMDYYVAPEGDEPHAEVASADELRVLDPACGSGHILTYAFDLLYQMYEEEGWPEEDIPAMILSNNLFGLEIDRRAAELASFALEMRARERDPLWFDRGLDAHVHVLEPVSLDAAELALVPELAERRELLDATAHLDQVGSLWVPDPSDAPALEAALARASASGDLLAASLVPKLASMLESVRALSRTFHCVVANPPYMGSGNMNPWLSGWIKKHYPDEKSDLCTCFINRALRFASQEGYASVITSDTCMYISSFERMRRKIIEGSAIVTFIDTRGTNAHPDVFDANAGWVLQKGVRGIGKGAFFKLSQSIPMKGAVLAEAIRDPGCGWLYRADAEDFKAIPGWPIAYWASNAVFKAFTENDNIGDFAQVHSGVRTGENNRFIRFWWEISFDNFFTKARTPREAQLSKKKWFPCNKGGGFRKWYGNNWFVVDWFDDGRNIRNHPGSDISPTRQMNWLFGEGLTWGTISSSAFSMRYSPAGFMYETKGAALLPPDKERLRMPAFMNSSVIDSIQRIMSPTLDYHEGPLRKIPYHKNIINDLSSNGLSRICVKICKEDYDAFETSWDFSYHPLLSAAPEAAEVPGASSPSGFESGASERLRIPPAPTGTLLSAEYARWEAECRERFDTLRANEEELNRIFARIYHMEGEVPIEVADDKVSVRLADRARDARSLVSYAVGCLFGRYSDERAGLVLADAGSTLLDFSAKVPGATFTPDEDGVLPVTAEEWFDDDAVTGIRRWLDHAFGAETLEDNVAWLEESLGKSLRAYLVRDFYADHVKTYQKRPIYWMFSSPKKTFQCLVYLHRYDEATVGTVLTSYLRPMQDKLRARLAALDAPGASAVDLREANKLRAAIAELEAWEREVIYPLAHERVAIDLDDGVRVNYNRFPKALAKVAGLSEWR